MLNLSKNAKIFFLIFISILLAHWPDVHGYFQVDDYHWLALGKWRSVLSSFTGPWGHGSAYRPILRLSYYLDSSTFGWHAGLWHVENLAITAMAGLFLAQLARRLGFQPLASLIAGLLFALAPIGIEDIDWISGRSGLLCACILIFGMCRWRDGVEQGRLTPLLAAFFSYLLGMATYEASIIFPALLLILIPINLASKKISIPRQLALIMLFGLGGLLFWYIRSLLLGSFGASVDGEPMSPIAAIQQNVPDALELFDSTWHRLGLAVLIAVALEGLLSSERRIFIISFFAMAVALYAPFVLVNGTAPRFLFLAQFPLCLLIASVALRPRFGLQVLLIVSLVFFTQFVPTDYRQANAVKHASNLGRRLLQQVGDLEQASPDANLVFDNVPDTEEGSWVMSYDFEEAVETRFGKTHAIIARSNTIFGDSARLDQVMTGNTRFFGFDPGTQQFMEVPKQAWVLTHNAQIAKNIQAS